MTDVKEYVTKSVYALVGLIVIGSVLVKEGIEYLKNTSGDIGGVEGTIIGIGSLVVAGAYILQIMGAFF